MSDPLAGVFDTPDPLADVFNTKDENTPPVSRGSGALSGYETGVQDFGKNIAGLGSGIAKLAQNPSEIGGVVGEGLEAGAHMLNPKNIPETFKGIFWDGMVKPFIIDNTRLVFDSMQKEFVGKEGTMSEEERFNLAHGAALATSGIMLGYGVGKVLSIGGKAVAASSKLKALTGATTPQGVSDAIATTLSPQDGLLASEYAKVAFKKPSLIGKAGVGSAEGFAFGAGSSQNPEDAFKNGVITGIAGGLLAPVLHTVLDQTGKGYKQVRAVAIERAREDMYSTLMKHAPEPTLEQTMQGVNFVQIGARNLPEGEGYVFHNLPEDFFPPEPSVGGVEGATRKALKLPAETPEMLELETQLKDIRRKYEVAELTDEQKDNYNEVANKLEGLRQQQEAKINAERNTKAGLPANAIVRNGKGNKKSVLIIGKDRPATTNPDVKGFSVEDLDTQISKAESKLAEIEINEKQGPMTKAGVAPEKDFWTNYLKDLNAEQASRTPSPVANPELIASWKETGYVPNQLIQFKGVDHQFLGVADGWAKIRDLTTGKEAKTRLKNLEPSSGRIKQVEYKPESEILMGKRYVSKETPGLVAALSRNTNKAEGPWRVSYFMLDEKSNVQTYGHKPFDTPEAAIEYVTGTPVLSAVDAFKGLQGLTNFQGFTEVDSKSKTIPAELRTADTPFEVKQYPEILAETKKLLEESPEDYAQYKQNVERIVDEQKADARKVSESLATYGVMASRAADGTFELRNPDGSFIDGFTTYEGLMDYARTLEGGGGDLIPPMNGVRTVGFDDNASHSLNQHYNLVNSLRDWYTSRFPGLATPYAYYTMLEQKFGRKFFNDFFLPLQHARTAYNKRLAGLAEFINPLLGRMGILTAERKGHISNAIESFSADEMRGDKPSILARTLTDHEKRLGEELGTYSTKDDRIAAYEYHRAESHLKESLKGASRAEALRMGADFQASVTDKLSDTQKKVVQIFKNVRESEMDDVSLYAINRLADATESKSLNRSEYMDLHKFTPDERKIVEDLDKTYQVLADEFGIDKGSRLGGYITHAVEYDGKVVDGSVIFNSKYLPAKTRDFVYSMIRTGEMQNLIRDPAILLTKYVTQGARNAHLSPEITKAKNFLKTAYSGLDEGTSNAIHQKSISYMNQILGIIDPEDALVGAETLVKAQGALAGALTKIGVDHGTTDKWLKKYFKISELATQGFKPIAGVRDATSTLMYWHARFGTKRLASILSDWNLATDTKGILQEQGKIPGLTVEFFTGMDGALSDKTFLDRAAELGFKFSGQPYVYQQFHAMAHINTVKTVLRAAGDLEAKKITQRQFEKKIGLSTYDTPQAQRFTELLRRQPREAAEYLADITGRETVGYYGMANHPFFMSTRRGKVLGQHGQWPLWMVQNFGRLMSQGSRLQRVNTAMKVAGFTGAIMAGGRAAGFNLGSWTFSPDNAIFLGGPVAQSAGWAALYYGSNDPGIQEFAGRMLERSDLTNPQAMTRSQYFLPLPSQAYNILWGLARANNGDPLHVIGAQIMGIPIDQSQYPK